MLKDLQIRNFALIDELELRFEPGFNVITGETGAGKTILMAALELAVGGKASADVIRTGAEEAAIDASLIRVYGQHEHQTLRQSDTHLGLVDAFAGHGELLERMRERFATFHE